MHRRFVAVVLTLIGAAQAGAVVLGGGLADTDCTVFFDGVDATDGESGVVCTDGDPACDVDATANGTCRFDIRLCTRLPASGCTPRDLTSIAVAGHAFDVPAVSTEPACGALDAIAVPVGGAAAATSIARDGRALKDVDYLNVCCRAEANPFDAASCALRVDASIAGCTAAVPSSFVAKLAKARDLVAQAAAHPAAARGAAKRAVRALRRARRIARRLAASDDCGNALGLVASHAIAVLQAAL